MKAVEVTYRIGRNFWPSPHYDETIAELHSSPDNRTLMIETAENRKFTVALSGEAKLIPLLSHRKPKANWLSKTIHILKLSPIR